MFALADVIPGFAANSWVEMDLITLLVGLNSVGFCVLTWTLCTIADLQIKSQARLTGVRSNDTYSDTQLEYKPSGFFL